MIVALLSASFSLVFGVLAGAALQRWGDADRATEHHTRYTRELPEPDEDIHDLVQALLSLPPEDVSEQVNWRYWLHG